MGRRPFLLACGGPDWVAGVAKAAYVGAKAALLRNRAGEMFGGFFPLGRDLVSAALCFAETARWRTYAASSDA